MTYDICTTGILDKTEREKEKKRAGENYVKGEGVMAETKPKKKEKER